VIARALMLLACALAATGCIETRFESPPGDNIETCDARWKGLWTGEDIRSSQDATAFFVDDECRFEVLDQPERGGPIKRLRVPVNFVHADRNDYLVVADTGLKGLVELKAPYGVAPAPEKSFFFARYSAHGERIDIYKVDDKRVAKQIIDGKIDGTVSQTANELHVYVRGDRARTLEILRHGGIFVDKSDMVLHRVNQTVDEFERTMLARQKNAKP